MSDNFKDILSNLSTDLDQETLLLYLHGKLSEEKKREVEKHLVDNEFTDDALDGLQQFKDKQLLSFFVAQLNRDMRHRLDKKKKFREKLRYKDQPWLYLSVIIILLLIILGYFVIHHYMNP